MSLRRRSWQATAVARATNTGPTTRARPFARRWDDALAIHIEALEAECDRRGKDGVDKPVFWKGEKIATVKQYYDNLLMFRRCYLGLKTGMNLDIYRPLAGRTIRIRARNITGGK